MLRFEVVAKRDRGVHLRIVRMNVRSTNAQRRGSPIGFLDGSKPLNPSIVPIYF